MTMGRETFARRFGVACMLAAFLAAVVLAATGVGEAHGAQQARFWATFRAEKTIGWSEPRWTTREDCWHSWWTQGSGRQTERYESTMPVKLLAYTAGMNNSSVFFKWRTWDEFAESSDREMPAVGTITRQATRSEDWVAGTCGVRGVIIDDEGNERTTPVPRPPDDCGTRKPGVDGWIGTGSKYMWLDTGASFASQEAQMGFRACELNMPYEMDERGWSVDIRGRYSRAELFNPGVPVVKVSAGERYSQKQLIGGARAILFTSGSVSWTVTLRRAAPPRRGGRR